MEVIKCPTSAIVKENSKKGYRFFENTLKYTYNGNLSEQENTNIIEDKLSAYLKKPWDIPNGLLAVQSTNSRKPLKFAARFIFSEQRGIYSLLKYGAKVKEDIGSTETVYFIDFDDR